MPTKIPAAFLTNIFRVSSGQFIMPIDQKAFYIKGYWRLLLVYLQLLCKYTWRQFMLNFKKSKQLKWLISFFSVIIFAINGYQIKPLSNDHAATSPRQTNVVHAATFKHHSRTHVILGARNTQAVFIASNYGRKYHFSRNCRGLRPAKSRIIRITQKQAINRGYTLCKWEK